MVKKCSGVRGNLAVVLELYDIHSRFSLLTSLQHIEKKGLFSIGGCQVFPTIQGGAFVFEFAAQMNLLKNDLLKNCSIHCYRIRKSSTSSCLYLKLSSSIECRLHLMYLQPCGEGSGLELENVGRNSMYGKYVVFNVY